MRRFTTPIALFSLYAVAASAEPLNPRQNADEAYIRRVCYPTGSSTPKPPCISIEDIGWQCAPNGTEPLALEAHKQCMCGGSFFSDYVGCQACLLAHGARSERDNAKYVSVVSAASSAFCGGSGAPTKAYEEIFSSLDAAAVPVTTGQTASSDRLSGQTQVSLYFTATGPQGPGPITGSATGATNKPAPTETRSSGTSGTTSSSTSGATGGNVPATTSSSSGIGATPTAALGGVAFGLAAGAFAAVF